MRDVVESSMQVARDRLWSLVRVLVFLLLVPVVAGGFFVGALYNATSNEVPSPLRVVVLILWMGASLGVAAAYATDQDRRRKLLELFMRDGDYGWLSPLVLSGFAFLFATSGFSSLTVLLYEWDVVDAVDRTCTGCPLVFDDFMNFYTWHFLDAVPLLEVNETLRWEEPIEYRGALAGWLVLAVKVAVILPIVQLVRNYWKLRSEIPKTYVTAWRRIVHVGDPVRVRWAGAPPPSGFVFDVYVKPPANTDLPPIDEPRQEGLPGFDTPDGKEHATTLLVAGPGWTLWRRGEKAEGSNFSARGPGKYMFQARWRRETEGRYKASNTPRTVTVTVKPPPTSQRRVAAV